jgi:hypothetical protein
MNTSVTMATSYNSTVPRKGEEAITELMIDLASSVALANNVGTELVANHLNEEASFHFQLAIEKVMNIHSCCGLPSDFGSKSSKCALHYDSQVVDYATIQDFSSPGKIAPPSSLQMTTAVEYIIWLKCAALVALRNSIQVKTRMCLRRDANRILDCATRMLDEIDGDSILKRLFYHDRTQHVILGMSLRMLQGERMMTKAGLVSAYSERRRKTMVHEAMKQLAHAVDLGRVFFAAGAKENSLVAQALSRLGYCLMLEGEESLASIVYAVASQEYSTCRQEGSEKGEEDLLVDGNPVVVLGAAAA